MKVNLNGDSLPWVTTAKHLGNHLSSKLNHFPYSPETKTDLLCKRAILFDKVHQIQQQFGYYEPRLVLRLLSIYSTALYGSPLWQLNSEEHSKLNRSWNAAVKIIWDLPNPTHTRFLETLCPVPHLESVLTGRYIGFIQNLVRSSSGLLNLLFHSCAGNLSTVTGQNLHFLLENHQKSNIYSLFKEKNRIKKSRIYSLPEDEAWKVGIIEELSLVKKEHLEINFDKKNLEDILEFLCTN